MSEPEELDVQGEEFVGLADEIETSRSRLSERLWPGIQSRTVLGTKSCRRRETSRFSARWGRSVLDRDL